MPGSTTVTVPVRSFAQQQRLIELEGQAAAMRQAQNVQMIYNNNNNNNNNNANNGYNNIPYLTNSTNLLPNPSNTILNQQSTQQQQQQHFPGFQVPVYKRPKLNP